MSSTSNNEKRWGNPLLDGLLVTQDSESFPILPFGFTGLPVGDHVGAFGVSRKHDIHTGVDLYSAHESIVFAVEKGVIVAILPFTGEEAGSPWWNDTQAVMVEGESGVVLYGEIFPYWGLKVGHIIYKGECVGHVDEVLKVNKGRPTSMLHMELYTPGTKKWVNWGLGEPKPDNLLDPTPFLVGTSEGTLNSYLSRDRLSRN